ncbi:MAG: class I SAM-dependent methyltransferase [Promethearchaeota archaeon]
MGLAKKMVDQVRKPKGRFGRLMARGMNRGHAKMANWGLTHISINSTDIILDVGCGGGGNVHKFANIILEGKVYGIDYSEVSVEVSKKVNKKLIEGGRVKIHHASVSSLPFENNTFDLVTGFEAYYFWPDLITDLKEIYRVLKTEGTLLLVNEAYKCANEKFRRRNEKWAKLGNFEIHSSKEFEEFLEKAGYSEIEVFEEKDKGWLAIKGKKTIS